MTSGSTGIRPRRCTMFLPGVSPDMFAKAIALDVDGVCVDLEDAVAPDDKDAARERTLPLFADTSPTDRKLAILRINSLRTRDGLTDMLAVLDCETPPPALLLPKVDTASEVRWAEELLLTAKRPVELYALIETNLGLENVFDIARSTPLLKCLVFGAADLSAALNAKNEWAPLIYARSRVQHAAATAGVDVIDVPHLDLDDEEGLRHDARAGQALGFAGKFAIHPKQVAIINEAYTPSADAIAYAQKVVAAFEKQPSGLLVVDGKLIEKPVLRALRRTLAIAEQAGQ
jgi:(S)-citramalyl-CoA lyase